MNKGFTLVELLIVIVIIGVLATTFAANFVPTLQRGNDARRKADLSSVQKSLEEYYSDNNSYPFPPSHKNIFNDNAGGPFCTTSKCLAGEKTYLPKMPTDSKTTSKYFYDLTTDGTFYRMYACLENTKETSSAYHPSGYAGTDCGPCVSGNLCNYSVVSSNITP